MSELNRDVLYLIIKELQNDKKVLVSCLLVNKMFCETTIPILWENPWKVLTLLKSEIPLIEIKFDYCNGFRSLEVIQAIHQSCPYLKYLKLLIYGLDAKSSSANLFKFKFRIIFSGPSDYVKLFFDNWRGKRPILLSFNKKVTVLMEDLLKEYEAKGIIKNYNNNLCDADNENEANIVHFI
ncbi:hypothetical protein C1646_755414 [Rhizophagus diaphanus]|nr:hypothetical protein C1646_755414 [Rhizophagus diaphanus] [Rhizophagus sp. MUCL 43196]